MILNNYVKNIRCYPLPQKFIKNENPLKIVGNDQACDMENEGGASCQIAQADDQNDWGGLNEAPTNPQDYRSTKFYETIFNGDKEETIAEEIKTMIPGMFDYSFFRVNEIEKKYPELKKKYDGIISVYDRVNIGNYLHIPYFNTNLLMSAVRYIDSIQKKRGLVLVNTSGGMSSVATILAAYLRYKKYLDNMKQVIAYIRNKYGKEAIDLNPQLNELFKFEHELIRG